MKVKKLEWQALEHVYYEKTGDWYWGVGIVGVTAAILALIFGNAIFALLLLIATATIIIHAAHVPKIVKVEIMPNGVRVGSDYYAYSQLKGFSLDEEHNPPILVLDSKAFLRPDIRIFIEDKSPEEIRDFLLDHLDEKYHEPAFTEALIHYLGF